MKSAVDLYNEVASRGRVGRLNAFEVLDLLRAYGAQVREQDALKAGTVLDWCKPIGQYDHMQWYNMAGNEIAEAIRKKELP